MVFMVASDIHGSAYWCERMLDLYKRSGADRLLLLGDIQLLTGEAEGEGGTD